jgi:hypothetical protein
MTHPLEQTTLIGKLDSMATVRVVRACPVPASNVADSQKRPLRKRAKQDEREKQSRRGTPWVWTGSRSRE